MIEKRVAHIRVVVSMCKAGVSDLRLTKEKTRDFLRGIIDYAENGRHTNLDIRWAPLTYKYSKKASILKHKKSAYENRSDKTQREKKLHAEHVIPNGMIYNRLIEMVEANKSDQEISDFLEEACEIVVITKAEMKLLDGRGVGLKSNMPDGWNWGDSKFARLKKVGIELESRL